MVTPAPWGPALALLTPPSLLLVSLPLLVVAFLAPWRGSLLSGIKSGPLASPSGSLGLALSSCPSPDPLSVSFGLATRACIRAFARLSALGLDLRLTWGSQGGDKTLSASSGGVRDSCWFRGDAGPHPLLLALQ